MIRCTFIYAIYHAFSIQNATEVVRSVGQFKFDSKISKITLHLILYKQYEIILNRCCRHRIELWHWS